MATTILDSIVSNSRTGRERSLVLSESTLIANVSGFIGANASAYTHIDPDLIPALQRMNQFLLNNKVRTATVFMNMLCDACL